MNIFCIYLSLLVLSAHLPTASRIAQTFCNLSTFSNYEGRRLKKAQKHHIFVIKHQKFYYYVPYRSIASVLNCELL
jgi:hypothetical protein